MSDMANEYSRIESDNWFPGRAKNDNVLIHKTTFLDLYEVLSLVSMVHAKLYKINRPKQIRDTVSK